MPAASSSIWILLMIGAAYVVGIVALALVLPRLLGARRPPPVRTLEKTDPNDYYTC